jgi:hypothetical protein
MGVFLTSASTPRSWGRYSGGTGEPNDPYRIATPEDLNDIGNYEEDWDKHFILVNDVNLAQYTGTQFYIIGRWIDWSNSNNKPFTGVFDGNGHKISNFTWSITGMFIRGGFGLFGYLGASGQIKNLGMENVDVNALNWGVVGALVGCSGGIIMDCYSTGSVSGNGAVGGLVGLNYDGGWITNCYSSGSISAYVDVGGLVGVNYRGTITNCYSTGSVSGNEAVGGLVGDNDHGTTTNCYSTGSVSGTGYFTGGLVGDNNNGTITDCYSTGSTVGNYYVGGLAGSNAGTITNCYSTGSVSGIRDVGGLVGANGHTITNCYSISSVSGDRYVGGLVGFNSVGTITKSYSTGRVMGTGYGVGGLVGSNSEGTVETSFWDIETSGQGISDGGTGKTTAEMKIMSTFTDAGWDFVEIWDIGEKQTYPFLLTEPAGDWNHDKKVDLTDLAILASHWLDGTPP